LVAHSFIDPVEQPVVVGAVFGGPLRNSSSRSKLSLSRSDIAWGLNS
jgi:hypothetical protein